MKAPRLDANQSDVVAGLEADGCTVLSLAKVGDGCPDLLIGVDGENVLMELKDGMRPPSERLLTPKQKKFHTEWKGTVHLANSLAEALTIVAYVRRKNRGRPAH